MLEVNDYFFTKMPNRLKAKFVKLVDDRGFYDDKSYWEVTINSAILFCASVEYLRSKRPELSYEIIATVKFGRELIQRTKDMIAFW